MGLVAGQAPLKSRTGPRDAELRHSRVCYNHLAGDMGIQLYDSLFKRGYLKNQNDVLNLTSAGNAFTKEFGIDIESLKTAKTPLCRECLDWSERRSHLAGSLGRAFLSRFETLRWARRVNDSRIIRFSKRGTELFNSTFT